MSDIKTTEQFISSYKNGQRFFDGLEFDNSESFAGENLSDATFTNCYFYADFSNANLANTKFIDCNLKTSDFRGANLTGALIKNCAVDAAVYKGAKTDNFIFENNFYHGHVLDQKFFEEKLKNSDY